MASRPRRLSRGARVAAVDTATTAGSRRHGADNIAVMTRAGFPQPLCAVVRMLASPTVGTLRDMDRTSSSTDKRLRVVVAGGGVAGLETLIALRALAGERVDLALVAPEEHFALRALTVFEPFGGGDPRRHALAEVTEDLGAAWHRDAVIRVDRARHTVRLASGAALRYDVLVLAVGALPYPAYEHGVSYDRACDREPFDELLADARAGLAGHVAVIASPG